MGALPPDVAAALERALPCQDPDTGEPCKGLYGCIGDEHHQFCPRGGVPLIVAALAPLLAAREAKLAEAVASEARARGALEDLEAEAREGDDPKTRRRILGDALATPPSRPLAEMRELRAACAEMLHALADPMRWEELERAREQATAAIAATDWLVGPPEGG